MAAEEMTGAPDAPHDEYKIVIGNVRQDIAAGETELALADMALAMDTYSPDIVLLQEATVGKEHDTTTGYLGAVASRHEMKPDFYQTRHFQKPRLRKTPEGTRVAHIHSGVANLVSQELAPEVTTTEIPLSEQKRATRVRPLGRRGLLVTSIRQAGERPLHFVNAHLSYPTGFNQGTRKKEWIKLFETVDSLDGDVVVAGDFNAGPKSTIVAWCNERLRAVSDQTQPTWHNLKKVMKRTLPPQQRTIDYVFTNKDFKRSISVAPMGKGHSDHIWHLLTIGRRPNDPIEHPSQEHRVSPRKSRQQTD